MAKRNGGGISPSAPPRTLETDPLPLHGPGLGHSTVKWVVPGPAEENSFPERPSHSIVSWCRCNQELPPSRKDKEAPWQKGTGLPMPEGCGWEGHLPAKDEADQATGAQIANSNTGMSAR